MADKTKKKQEPVRAEYIGSGKASELLDVTPGTVKNMVDRGNFPGTFKVDPTRKNSPFRIPLQAVMDFIKKQRGQP